MTTEPPSENSETITPEGQVSEFTSLAEFLANDDPAERPSNDGDPVGDNDEKGEPSDLKSLAETLKTKPESLYKLKIPMANGESRTLGELKDIAAKQDDISFRELEFEESRSKAQAELTRAQSELREIISQLPKSAISDNVRAAYRKKHEQTVALERQKTLEAIPEWQDSDRRTAELADIVEHLKDYGFSADFLSSVYDARTLKYIRDNYLREKRLRTALEKAKKAPPSSSPRSGKSAAPAKAINKGVAPKRNSTDPLAAFLSS